MLTAMRVLVVYCAVPCLKRSIARAERAMARLSNFLDVLAYRSACGLRKHKEEARQPNLAELREPCI